MTGSEVPVGTVIGFPHGTHEPEVKARESALALEKGARELDMVMNYARFRSGERDFVRRDIEAVVEVARPTGALVKVILEVGYLTNEQIREACLVARDAGADFVKTSTGFGEGQATPEIIDIMMDAVGDTMGVKPAGGIKTWDTAVLYLDKGCSRLGVAFTEDVLAGGQS
jgi:deoxyribose-phosphate aldolase